MKRWKAVCAVGAAVLFAWGCQKGSASEDGFCPETSSIYVAKDGGIFSATVETYETGNYDGGSLRKFIMDEVEAYNGRLGGSFAAGEDEEGEIPPVSVNSCQAEEGRLWVIYQYKNSESFRDFAEEYHDAANQTISFGTGTAAAGREAGWFTDAEFIKVGRGAQTVSARQKDLERLGKERMVMVEADHLITIQTEGTILYVTRDVAVVGKNTVQVPEGKHFVIFR